jgi:hypothetical protein
MFNLRNRVVSSICLLALVAFSFLVSSDLSSAQQEMVRGITPPDTFTARSMTAPKPTAVSRDPQAFAAPMSNSEADDREGQLGAHHRPTPIADLAPDAMALIPPPSAQTQSAPQPQAITVPMAENRPLTDAETSNVTSTVNEPSVATGQNDEVLITANWFAAFSTDGGATFDYRNPSNTFPASPQGAFCCDQVALYDADADVMFWFLQYINNTNQNTVRLAVAQGADIAAEQWQFYDFTPLGVGNWNNEWFDYPDLAVSDDFLYITTNAFSTTGAGGFTRAVIIRIPLSELAAYQALNFDVWDTTQNGSLRLTQGAADTMYFASHVSPQTLRVFSWPENAATITSDDVAVTPWPRNGARPGWTARSDSRITAAWMSGDQIGFGWTASEGSGFPHPHARFAIVDRNSMNLDAEPHLWNQNFPYAYPAAAPNGAGRVGLGVHFGDDPSHAVAVLGTATNPLAWDLVTSATGTDSPASNLWGDYTSVRVDGADPLAWVATGFTLDGGTARGDIVTRYLQFSETAPPQPPTTTQVTVQVENQAERMGDGDTKWVRATVTINGTPANNQSVDFASVSPLLSVAPATASTNAQGVAQATLTSHADWNQRETVEVTATANGVTSSPVDVLVPDVSILGLVLLLATMLSLGLYWRRRMAG